MKCKKKAAASGAGAVPRMKFDQRLVLNQWAWGQALQMAMAEVEVGYGQALPLSV